MWPTTKNGLPWSQEDIKQLRELAESGMTATEIASSLNRTKIGVKSKALSLGISLPPHRRHPGSRAGAPDKAFAGFSKS
jgi:hypothetical protein